MPEMAREAPKWKLRRGGQARGGGSRGAYDSRRARRSGGARKRDSVIQGRERREGRRWTTGLGEALYLDDRFAAVELFERAWTAETRSRGGRAIG